MILPKLVIHRFYVLIILHLLSIIFVQVLVFVGNFHELDLIALLMPSHGVNVIVDEASKLLYALQHCIEKC